MIFIQIILGWSLLGIMGWFIGTITDMIFCEDEPIQSPLCFIGGPITLGIAFYRLMLEIVLYYTWK